MVGDDDKANYFTIGGYDLESYARSDLNWHPIKDSTRWSVNFDGFELGDKQIDASSNLAYIDSGASFIMMPRRDFL